MGYLGILVWAFAMASIKTSVALTLLRFLHTTPWRMFLYALIALQAATALSVLLFLTLQCRPLHAAWDPIWAASATDPNTTPSTQAASPESATCWEPVALRTSSNASAALNIATDVALSLTPLAFLKRLQRPRRERALLAILMATGLAASAASLRKTVLVQGYGDPDQDYMALNVSIPTWTCLEELLALIAACLPAAKLPMQRALLKLKTLMDSEARRVVKGPKHWSSADEAMRRRRRAEEWAGAVRIEEEGGGVGGGSREVDGEVIIVEEKAASGDDGGVSRSSSTTDRGASRRQPVAEKGRTEGVFTEMLEEDNDDGDEADHARKQRLWRDKRADMV